MRVEFPPSLTTLHSHAWLDTDDGGLSNDEAQLIIDLGDSFPKQQGSVGDDQNNPTYNEEYRASELSWIPLGTDNQLDSRIAWIARLLNGQFFRYDLWGMAESYQFTTYHPNNQHYEWHQDLGDIDPPRKMSMVVMLSDPEEFEGGELQILLQKEPETLPKVRNRVYMFPAHTLHRVTPVTAGIRRSLVMWITGPALR